MKTGLVVEVKEEYAIVLANDGSMDRIKIKDGMKVGQKLFYFDEDIVVENTVINKTFDEVSDTAKESKKKGKIIDFASVRFMKTISAIAAMFAFVFTMFYNFSVDETYVVVSLDINPSIQISADVNQKILKVEGMNDDGKNIDFSEIKGEKLDNGIEKVKDILVEKKYLEKNKDVLVAVSIPDDNNNYEENIKDTVNATFGNENIVYIKVDAVEDVKEAAKENISLGRYEATKLSNDTTKTEAAVAPVKEITEKIKENDKVIYWNNAEKQDKSEDNTELQKNEIPKENIEDKTNKDEVKKEEEKAKDKDKDKDKETLNKQDNTIKDNDKNKDSNQKDDKVTEGSDNKKTDVPASTTPKPGSSTDTTSSVQKPEGTTGSITKPDPNVVNPKPITGDGDNKQSGVTDTPKVDGTTENNGEEKIK